MANEATPVGRIDLLGTVRTVTPVRTIPTAITVADGSGVGHPQPCQQLAQLNARSGRHLVTGSGPVAVAAEDDRVFVANQLSSTVSSI